MKLHFMAGTKYQVCGHKHRSWSAAKKCVDKIGSPFRVWMIWYDDRKRRWREKDNVKNEK